MVEALAQAIHHLGGQSALARACNVSQATVWHWLHKSKRVPAEYVADVERATEGLVTKAMLRPDLFEEAPRKNGKRRVA